MTCVNLPEIESTINVGICTKIGFMVSRDLGNGLVFFSLIIVLLCALAASAAYALTCWEQKSRSQMNMCTQSRIMTYDT